MSETSSGRILTMGHYDEVYEEIADRRREKAIMEFMDLDIKELTKAVEQRYLYNRSSKVPLYIQMSKHPDFAKAAENVLTNYRRVKFEGIE